MSTSYHEKRQRKIKRKHIKIVRINIETFVNEKNTKLDLFKYLAF